jgi:hypothetical protein
MLLVALGIVLGVGLVISCGQGPSTADAADTCNCPAAEPPLTGRVVQVTAKASILAGFSQSAVSVCPAGATVLAGGCRLDALNPDVILVDDGPLTPNDGTSIGWYCGWKNPTADTVNVTGFAICLTPAP